jgi:hypothetical protein
MSRTRDISELREKIAIAILSEQKMRKFVCFYNPETKKFKFSKVVFLRDRETGLDLGYWLMQDVRDNLSGEYPVWMIKRKVSRLDVMTEWPPPI